MNTYAPAIIIVLLLVGSLVMIWLRIPKRKTEMLRVIANRERRSVLFQVFNSRCEVAWLSLGIKGLALEMETTTDWHETNRNWFRVGFGIGSAAISFPRRGPPPIEDGSWMGPTYGFSFVGGDLLVS